MQLLRTHVMRAPARAVLAAVLAAVMALGSQAVAQFEGDPYFERPDDVRLAYRTFVMDARLTALAEVAREGQVPEDLGEQVEELEEADLPRIAGSLVAADADLLDELREHVEAVDEAFASGDAEAVATTADVAVEATVAARNALIGADALDDPNLRAAVMAQLLLGEPGAAEGYEELFEERWEFAVGWAVLQKVHALWDGWDVDESDARAGFEESLAALDELMPQVIPPEGPVVGDPEDSEGAAHDGVAYLQQIAGASLHPDNDLARLAGHLVGRAGTACGYYADGEAALGREYALSVLGQFEYLEDVAATLVPDAAEEAEEALEDLSAEGAAGGDHAAMCEDATGALEQIQAMLGG